MGKRNRIVISGRSASDKCEGHSKPSGAPEFKFAEASSSIHDSKAKAARRAANKRARKARRKK